MVGRIMPEPWLAQENRVRITSSSQPLATRTRSKTKPHPQFTVLSDAPSKAISSKTDEVADAGAKGSQSRRALQAKEMNVFPERRGIGGLEKGGKRKAGDDEDRPVKIAKMGGIGQTLPTGVSQGPRMALGPSSVPNVEKTVKKSRSFGESLRKLLTPKKKHEQLPVESDDESEDGAGDPAIRAPALPQQLEQAVSESRVLSPPRPLSASTMLSPRPISGQPSMNDRNILSPPQPDRGGKIMRSFAFAPFKDQDTSNAGSSSTFSTGKAPPPEGMKTMPKTPSSTRQRIMGSISRFQKDTSSRQRAGGSPVKSAHHQVRSSISIFPPSIPAASVTPAMAVDEMGRMTSCEPEVRVEALPLIAEPVGPSRPPESLKEETEEQPEQQSLVEQTKTPAPAISEPVKEESGAEDVSMALPEMPETSLMDMFEASQVLLGGVLSPVKEMEMQESPARAVGTESAPIAHQTRTDSLPPTRIPVPTRPNRLSTASSITTLSERSEAPASSKLHPSGLPLPKASVRDLSSLGRGLPPPRRPSSILTQQPSSVKSSASSTVDSLRGSSAPSILIKPQTRLPSSLGSSVRPTTSGGEERKSGQPSALRFQTPSAIPRAVQSNRTVSEPVRAPLGSAASRLNASTTSRRQGITEETSQSLAGLSEALKTLKTKRAPSISHPHPTGMPRHSPEKSTTAQDRSMSISEPVMASERIASIHRPRSRMSHVGDGSIESDTAGDRSLAALMTSSNGEGCFKGVVAFVDVRTSEGDDASTVFVDMLRSLGAKVTFLSFTKLMTRAKHE